MRVQLGKSSFKIKNKKLLDGQCHFVAVRRMEGKVTLYLDDKAFPVGESNDTTPVRNTRLLSTPNLTGNYMIPVVFHMINSDQTILDDPAIQNRVNAQIDELNLQFANNNTTIQFCLVENPPEGMTWQQFDGRIGTNTVTPGITILIQ